MNKIKIIGIGPGALQYITPAAMDAIKLCDLVVGGKRNLKTLQFLGKETLELGSDMEDIILRIDQQSKEKRVCAVVSGDPGFHSFLGIIVNTLGRSRIEVIPGISSFQYLFCRLNKSWEDYSLLSLHGRQSDYQGILKEHKGVFLLTDRLNTPFKIAQDLIRAGMTNALMTIGENLSYDDEKITEGQPKVIADMQFSELSVVVIEQNGLDI